MPGFDTSLCCLPGSSGRMNRGGMEPGYGVYVVFRSGIIPKLVGLSAALLLSATDSAAGEHVSAYYYPWYAGANWNPSNFLRGKNRMDIPPLMGTYDNATNQ